MQSIDIMNIYVTDKENIYKYKIDKISEVTSEHVKVINDTPGGSVAKFSKKSILV